MSNSLTAAIKKILKTEEPLTIIVTIGNDLRCDDGVGPYIGKHIVSHKKSLKILNVFDKPEKILEESAGLNPEKIVIIDAADFSGKPGQIKIIDKNHIPQTTLSTHTIPLSVTYSLVEKDTKAKMFFLGIQVKDVSYGEKLSREVKKTASLLIKNINSNG